MTRTHEQLAAENAELRACLEDAQEALVAIRTGQVDALVVRSGPNTRKVYTLEGADQPYRVFVEVMQQGAVTLSADGSIFYCNRRFAAMMKVAAERLIGTSFETFVLEADRPRFAALMKKGETGMSQGEVGLKTRAGAVLPAYLHLSPLPLKGGTALCLVVTDLTERKEHEALAEAKRLLAESEARLRVTLSSIGDAVIATDTEGRVTFLNGVAQSLTGWKGEEAQGRPLSEVFKIVNEETRLPLENLAVRALNEGTVEGSANRPVLIDKHGTERPIDDSAAPIRDERGTIAGAVLVFRDVTERRRAENEVRKNQEIFKLVHSIGKIGHWEWNALTDENKWSPEIEALYGLKPGAFEGTYAAWQKLLHPDDLAKAQKDVRQSLETGKYFTEFRVIWPDGSVHWLEARANVFKDAQGRPERIMGVNMDVTERKRVEETLKEADHRKDEFLATLAHELRNPLAPIRNALHIIRLTGDGKAAPLMTDMMERQVSHLVRLVDDLLDVSRITRDKIELRKERLELAAVVQSALETSCPLIEAGKHELTVTLPPVPLCVVGDETRLAQVLSNLLNNSARYTPEGGHIWLTVERNEHEAVVRVRDNGTGIPSEMLPKVFEMFTQVDRTLERAQGGLGIGLTLVKRLVQMHGGTVEARSSGAGHGSEFTMRLPLLAEKEASQLRGRSADQGETPTAAAKRRILVVDDNQDAAESLALLLRMMGNEVHTAHDGLAGVEAAAAFRPDVVLLDLGMPKMNGYDVARRMRELHGNDVVLIALTGWGQVEDRRRSSEAGFNYHMVKPLDPAALQQLIVSLSSR